MKRSRLLWFVVLLQIALQTACKKKEVEPVPAASLVKTINSVVTVSNVVIYKIPEKYTYTYNGSNQLTQIDFPTTNYVENFVYDNNLLVKFQQRQFSRSLDFVYDSQKKVSSQSYSQTDGTLSETDVFSYSGDKIVKQSTTSYRMPHANDIHWSWTYNYNTDGLLSKIVVTDDDKRQEIGVITITGYSDECDFSAWVLKDMVNGDGFISPLVLKSMNRLPLLVKYVFSDGTGSNTYTYNYVINNRRIEMLTLSSIRTGLNDNTTREYRFGY